MGSPSPRSFPVGLCRLPAVLARVSPHGHVGKPQRAEEEREGEGPEGNVGAHVVSPFGAPISP